MHDLGLPAPMRLWQGPGMSAHASRESSVSPSAAVPAERAGAAKGWPLPGSTSRSLLPHTLRFDHPSKGRHLRAHHSQGPLGLPSSKGLFPEHSSLYCGPHTHGYPTPWPQAEPGLEWDNGYQGPRAKGDTSMAHASARSAPGVSVSLNICALGPLFASS